VAWAFHLPSRPRCQRTPMCSLKPRFGRVTPAPRFDPGTSICAMRCDDRIGLMGLKGCPGKSTTYAKWLGRPPRARPAIGPMKRDNRNPGRLVSPASD